MNLTTVLELLRATNLGEGNHAVFGSGPLLVRGVIDSVNDIDVVARGEAWRRATAAGKLVHLPKYDIAVVSLHDGKLTVGTSWAIGNPDIDDAIDNAENIEDLPWVRLDFVVAYKRIANRPKDREHLRLLEQWRTRNPG